MATERFIAIQADIQESAEPFWERWTIDEIDEDVARVLISRAREPERLRAISARVVAAESPSTGTPTPPSHVLRRESIDVELAPAAETWSEEMAAFFTRPRLEAFLRGRAGKPGLPDPRPLREGDTFWIVMPTGPTGGEAGEGGAGPALEASSALLERYEAARADVWDVTAAARQAAKRSYHQALRTAGEQPPREAQAR